MSSHPAPTRTLPSRPNLDQLRKQAKDLLAAFQAGNDAAVAEVARFERLDGKRDRAQFRLVDAQRVLARAYGFASWTKLKQQVDGITVEALCAAAQDGDIATVRTLARARPELVNAERGGKFGESIALHFAVLNRDASMTRELMALGANARAGIWPHRDATTARTIASDRGYDEILKIIDEAEWSRRTKMSPPGASIGSQTDTINKAILEGQTEEALRLLESDASLIGACNQNGLTPLHVAAWTHNPEMTAWLLHHGAPINAQAPHDLSACVEENNLLDSGCTPLDHAVLTAGWSTAGRKFPFMENSNKAPELFHETVRHLRSHHARLTPRAAVALGDRDAVLQFDRAGALKNEIHTLRGGLVSIAVRVDRIDMVALLLDLGLDPNESVHTEDGALQSWGMPLWFASMLGRHAIAELLLTRGADVNAIVYACGDAMCMAADEPMETLLRKHGARLTVEQVSDHATVQAILDGALPAQSLNVDEPTITDLAEQMLLAAGSSDPEIVRMCLPHVKRKQDDCWWNYALLRTTLPDSLTLLLAHGIDPNVMAEGGYTMLHHLASNQANAEHRVTLATLLLDAGASFDMRDSMLLSTPLGWACRFGRLDLVQLYAQRGADLRETEAPNWATPRAWAMKAGHQHVIEFLDRAQLRG